MGTSIKMNQTDTQKVIARDANKVSKTSSRVSSSMITHDELVMFHQLMDNPNINESRYTQDTQEKKFPPDDKSNKNKKNENDNNNNKDAQDEPQKLVQQVLHSNPNINNESSSRYPKAHIRETLFYDDNDDINDDDCEKEIFKLYSFLQNNTVEDMFHQLANSPNVNMSRRSSTNTEMTSNKIKLTTN